jgi:hypothetical protein
MMTVLRTHWMLKDAATILPAVQSARRESSEYGSCQVFFGPIHPKEYCIAWAAVTS